MKIGAALRLKFKLAAAGFSLVLAGCILGVLVFEVGMWLKFGNPVKEVSGNLDAYQRFEIYDDYFAAEKRTGGTVELQSRRSITEKETLKMPKDPGTSRVFIVGESDSFARLET
jgi:hypothetical protein